MAEFIYQEPFPIQEDKTKYRLLTKDYVKVVECDGRKILKVDPKGLEVLSKAAYSDVSFYLRAAHLQKLRNILEDPEATDNDKFVAYTMLLNQCVAAEGELPTCQDTGTAICIGHKGEDVWTGADDAECIARGVYETYRERNLRYSQVVPFTMTDEKNSGTNLPAQIDIYGGKPGMEYEFLFITKGGGSANKTFLYQQTKALLNEESLTKFIQQHIFDLGTSACPPYHLAICIGGTSAEMCLSTVKKASAGYLDELPTSGNEGGRCFRDLEWEEKVLKICRQSGVGAQFGGKYLVHDVRVIRAPRHAASCPVAIGVSCSADRNIKAKITPEGIFLEELEKNPARFLPAEAPAMSPAVDIDLDEGMDKVREILTKYPIKTRLNLKGTLIVARDIAHARIKQMLDEGKPMPEYFKKHPVYYAGPAKTPQGMACAIVRSDDGRAYGPLRGPLPEARRFAGDGGQGQPLAGRDGRLQGQRRILPRFDRRSGRHSGQELDQVGRGGGLPRTGHGGRTEDLRGELPGIHHRRRQGQRLLCRFQALKIRPSEILNGNALRCIFGLAAVSGVSGFPGALRGGRQGA